MNSARVSASGLLASVSPDLASETGHSLYLDRALAQVAAAEGWRFVSWANQKLPLHLQRRYGWLRPVFADTAFHVMNHDDGHRARFADALLECARSTLAESPSGPVTLFLYAGHVCHLVACWRLLQALPDPRLRIVFNLYAAYWEFTEGGARWQYMTEMLRSLLPVGAALVDRQRFVLTSDSQQIAGVAEALWGQPVAVLPFFSLSQPPAPVAAPPSQAGTLRRPIVVAYPSSVHRHRGFYAFPTMMERCRRAADASPLRFVFRTCLAETALSEEERGVCRRLEQLGGEVRHGSLTDDEMTRFYSEADIILSPYPIRHFQDRTSANVADALVYGKPVVATRDTWAGRLVEQLQCGQTFQDGDGESMGNAVLQVVAALPAYTRQALERGSAWSAENNVAALLAVILKWPATAPAAGRATIPAEGVLALLRLLETAGEDRSPVLPPAVPSMWQQRRLQQAESRLAALQVQNMAMRRAIEHYRASPVRALRLWLRRKLRQLTLEG